MSEGDKGARYLTTGQYGSVQLLHVRAMCRTRMCAQANLLSIRTRNGFDTVSTPSGYWDVIPVIVQRQVLKHKMNRIVLQAPEHL